MVECMQCYNWSSLPEHILSLSSKAAPVGSGNRIEDMCKELPWLILVGHDEGGTIGPGPAAIHFLLLLWYRRIISSSSPVILMHHIPFP